MVSISVTFVIFSVNTNSGIFFRHYVEFRRPYEDYRYLNTNVSIIYANYAIMMSSKGIVEYKI